MNYKSLFPETSRVISSGLVSDEIMTYPQQDFTVSFSDKAREMKETALEAALGAVRCTDPDEQRKCVLAQSLLKETLSLLEKSRKQAKEPAIEFGRKLDRACKEFGQELSDEMMRISVMVADYQMAEEKRVAAARALAEKELAEVEARRLAEIAKAQTVEEQDEINHKYNDLARETPVIKPDRVEGQRITRDWDVTVYDIWALARAHPACVKVEALTGQVKDLIRAGVSKIAGVTWKEKVRVDVRIGPGKVLEI